MSIYKGTNLVAGKTSGTQPSTFIYEQGVASDEWIITHNLNKYPSVTVVDSAKNVVTCSVQYVDANTCTLTMNGSFKGTAYLN